MLRGKNSVFSEAYQNEFNSNVIYMWQHRHTGVLIAATLLFGHCVTRASGALSGHPGFRHAAGTLRTGCLSRPQTVSCRATGFLED